MTQNDPSYGDRAVGLTFNPGGDPRVFSAKQTYAMLIDDLDELRGNSTDPEVKRMASIAITEVQTAQMWHIKLLTWKS